jgi:hypothetical protein
MVEPFVLKQRGRLEPESEPSALERYDEILQIWIDVASGEPLIKTLERSSGQSKFGETTITETREGVDASEISDIGASKFGETTMTKSQEGVDQNGEAPLDPQFEEMFVSVGHGQAFS